MTTKRLMSGVEESFNATRLLNLLQSRRLPSDDKIADQFDLWRRVIDSLPLTQGDYAFAKNWVDSAQRLWRRGEAFAARYQLRQVARRLSLFMPAAD